MTDDRYETLREAAWNVVRSSFPDSTEVWTHQERVLLDVLEGRDPDAVLRAIAVTDDPQFWDDAKTGEKFVMLRQRDYEAMQRVIERISHTIGAPWHRLGYRWNGPNAAEKLRLIRDLLVAAGFLTYTE